MTGLPSKSFGGADLSVSLLRGGSGGSPLADRSGVRAPVGRGKEVSCDGPDAHNKDNGRRLDCCGG